VLDDALTARALEVPLEARPLLSDEAAPAGESPLADDQMIRKFPDEPMKKERGRQASLVVPEGGIEPPLPCGNRILREPDRDTPSVSARMDAERESTENHQTHPESRALLHALLHGYPRRGARMCSASSGVTQSSTFTPGSGLLAIRASSRRRCKSESARRYASILARR
jgi:hypothetical protein